MVELARDFMLLVDMLTFLLGCAILGMAIYTVTGFAFLAPLVSLNSVYISMGVGAALIVVACFGCIASQRGHKGMLCFYLFIVTAALAAQIAATILIARFSGQLGAQGDMISGSITSAVDRELNNAILSTYVSCCIGCPPEQNCNNVQEYYNLTLGFCSENKVLVCDPVEQCDNDPNKDGCFQGSGDLIPPIAPDQALCTTFKDLKNSTGIPLVGPKSSGSCGGGDPNTYLNDVVAYFNSVFYWFIVGFAILCGIQALNLMAAIFLLCCTNDSRYKRG